MHVRNLGDASALERALADRDEENAAMREVTNALAREADLDPLLRVICEQAAAQCDASGATVVRLDGEHGHIVSATGSLQRLRNTRFPLSGSLTSRALEERRTVRADDYASEHPHFRQMADEFEIGPALFAPLLAHGRTLGTITVARRRGAAPFATREERRIGAIADYAALALWKAHLTEEARVANKVKGEFIATMSHELRTPLTALLGYEELFAEHILGPLTDQQETAVDRMRTSTQHLQTIIDEVLTFSRLEAGEERARLRDVLVDDIFHGVMAVLEPLARAKRIALSADVPEDPKTLHTDPDMLRRILVNLGGNAVKFTEQGSVTVTAARHADWVSFEVADTGIGIAKEDIARLFQPFSQLDSGFTRKFGGTGLGLFVSRRLADLLGGSIEVASAPGQGSTFTLRIPAELGSERAARAARHAMRVRDFTGALDCVPWRSRRASSTTRTFRKCTSAFGRAPRASMNRGGSSSGSRSRSPEARPARSRMRRCSGRSPRPPRSSRPSATTDTSRCGSIRSAPSRPAHRS